MAKIDELPLLLRTTLKVYPWRRIDPVPCATLRKPVTESRVALVTTAGLVEERYGATLAAVGTGE
jgi:hypothetical protein